MNPSPIQAKLQWPLSHAGHRDDCFQMWECLSRTGDCLLAPVDHSGLKLVQASPLRHSGKHATAFTQGNDFPLEPANSILLFNVPEQVYYKNIRLSRG